MTGTTEALGEKPVPVPLCPPQIPQGLGWGSNAGLRGERPWTARPKPEAHIHIYTHIRTQFLPRSKHSISITKTLFLVLFIRMTSTVNLLAPEFDI
jgi:hypothetical protein